MNALPDRTGARSRTDLAAGALDLDVPFDLGRRALEGSRPAAAVLLHAGLHLLGRRGDAALIDRGVALARAFAREVESRPGFELLAEPDCNIVVYRLRPPDADPAALDRLNQQVQELQRERGRGFVSRTTLQHVGEGPRTTLRVVLANPRTTLDDRRHVLAEQAGFAASL